MRILTTPYGLVVVFRASKTILETVSDYFVVTSDNAQFVAFIDQVRRGAGRARPGAIAALFVVDFATWRFCVSSFAGAGACGRLRGRRS